MPGKSREKVDRIDADNLKARMNEIVFVDARSDTALKRIPRQIPGAIHVPVKASDESVNHLPKNRTIVTYCTCSDERTSTRVARRLKEHGFEHVYPLRGGFTAWEKAGLPVEPLPRRE